MSEQATFDLGSIGLLGEYCPSLRKKNRSIFQRTGCMHLGPFLEHPEFDGCNRVQPFLTSEDWSSLVLESLEDNFAIAHSSNLCIFHL